MKSRTRVRESRSWIEHIRRIATVAVPTAVIAVAAAQTLGQEWQRTIGRPDTDERCQWVRQVSDGNYVAAGTRIGNEQFTTDIYVIKIDANGTLIWDRFVNTMDTEEWGFRVEEDSDGSGYCVSGEKIGPMGAYLIKFDPAGNQLWAREYRGTIGASAEQLGTSLEHIPGNGWILGSRLRLAGGTVEQAPVLHCVTPSGVVIWNFFYVDSRYGDSTFADILDIEHLEEGDFAVCGFTAKTITGPRENLVMRLDPAGNVLWARTYPISGHSDWARGIEVASNGDFIVTGHQAITPVGNSYLMRLNAVGDVLWYRTIDEFQSASSIEQDADGNIFLAGKSLTTGDDAALLKFDASGNFIWGWKYGDLGFSNDAAWACDLTDASEFHLIGATRAFGSGGTSDVYSVKTNAIGESGCNEAVFLPPIMDEVVVPIDVTFLRGGLVDDEYFPGTVVSGSNENVLCHSDCSLALELVSSNCPASGPATFKATGGAGGNVAFIWSFAPGSYTIPGSLACAGTVLGLKSPVTLAGLAAGNPAILTAPSVPGAACNRVYLQALDLNTCCTSNVIQFK